MTSPNHPGASAEREASGHLGSREIARIAADQYLAFGAREDIIRCVSEAITAAIKAAEDAMRERVQAVLQSLYADTFTAKSDDLPALLIAMREARGKALADVAAAIRALPGGKANG